MAQPTHDCTPGTLLAVGGAKSTGWSVLVSLLLELLRAARTPHAYPSMNIYIDIVADTTEFV